MDGFEEFRVGFAKVDAGDTPVEDLAEEFFEVGASFVENICVFDEADGKTGFVDAGGEVHVLAVAKVVHATDLFVDFSMDAHIVGPRVEFGNAFGGSACATGAEEGGHGIVDGLEERREVGAAGVGAAECIPLVGANGSVDGVEVAGGYGAIGIDE